MADFIMQVMPDIRFPVTDSDYPFLYVRRDWCCSSTVVDEERVRGESPPHTS
ncbi:hypothetical protein IPA56_004317 [Escherichia coli]|nr:hypothetical protein [Escherichia coli]